MATYYVNSGAGGANTGGSWTDAYLTFAQAITSATTNGDVIKVHKAHTEELGVDTVYTTGANIAIISVDKDASDAPTAMGTAAWIGNSTTNRSVSIVGGNKVYIYGLTIRTAGTTIESINIGADGMHAEIEECYLWCGNTNASADIKLGAVAANSLNTYVKAKNCTFRLGATTQSINIRAQVDIIGGSISSAGSIPATVFAPSSASDSGGSSLECIGFDASHAGSGYLVGDGENISFVATFTGCKLGASYVPLAPQTNTNKSSAQVWIFDSSSGDQHYHLVYSDALGDLTVSTSIYANDGASYDGTNHYSWKIVTSAASSYYTPFVSPWIEKYHSATSAITPYIEILRDGSATAYQDDEVWAEFGCKTTTGSTIMSFSNDKMALLGSAANQTTGVGASGWTGENATAWFGKCVAPASITPAEIGMLMSRVIVGEPSITVYVDPYIRT